MCLYSYMPLRFCFSMRVKLFFWGGACMCFYLLVCSRDLLVCGSRSLACVCFKIPSATSFFYSVAQFNSQRVTLSGETLERAIIVTRGFFVLKNPKKNKKKQIALPRSKYFRPEQCIPNLKLIQGPPAEHVTLTLPFK